MTALLAVVLGFAVLAWLRERVGRLDDAEKYADLVWAFEGMEGRVRVDRDRRWADNRPAVRIVRTPSAERDIRTNKITPNVTPVGITAGHRHEGRRSPAKPPPLPAWLNEPDDGICQPASGCPRCGKQPSPYRRHIPVSALSLYCFGHVGTGGLQQLAEAS